MAVRRTLFYLPHELGGVPLFGVGWLLAAWLGFGLLVVALTIRRRGWDRELWSQLPVFLLVAAAIVWLVPRVEEPTPAGALILPPVSVDVGLPIRGYGVSLLVAVVMGVTLACNRAARAGLNPDAILGLAFAMVLGGIVGARVFFAIQYWSLLRAETWGETLANLVSVDKGGLVVYGSLIGALASFGFYAWRQRLPLLPLADLIAPSLALGLAIGRIGCLLNGCCFGGNCTHLWAVTFPAGSPPYERQQATGSFHGVRLAEAAAGGITIDAIDADGPLAGQGLRVGQDVIAINGHPVDRLETAETILLGSGPELQLTLGDGRQVRSTLVALPARSRPVHPTQIYSSLNAGLLCLLTLAFYPLRRRHGQTMALLLSAYAVTRFLLEMIRTDEGEFLARLTISQNISLVIAGAMLALWIYVQRQPLVGESPVQP